MSGVVKVKSNPVLIKSAIQWTMEDKANVLEFLNKAEVQYSFHEIASAGELILYTVAGPVQVPFNCWIIFDATNRVINCESNETFHETYTILEEEEEEESSSS